MVRWVLLLVTLLFIGYLGVHPGPFLRRMLSGQRPVGELHNRCMRCSRPSVR